jgi:hypothetical protein
VFSMTKRRRIIQGRTAAAEDRLIAAKDLISAIAEAEDAMGRMKGANDRFYRSEISAEQAALDSLRRDRERMFIFHATAQIVADAPTFARLLGLRVQTPRPMPLEEWVRQINQSDLAAYGLAAPIESERRKS